MNYSEDVLLVLTLTEVIINDSFTGGLFSGG